MTVRHFLTLLDLEKAELLVLLKRASELKIKQKNHIVNLIYSKQAIHIVVFDYFII